MTAVIQNCNNRVVIEPYENSDIAIPQPTFLKRVNQELENFRSKTNIFIFLDGVKYSIEEFQSLLK